MLKRGLCGVELKHQIVVTGFLYAALGIVGFIFGFILLENPEYFADGAIAREKAWENKETQHLQDVRIENEHQLDDILKGVKNPEFGNQPFYNPTDQLKDKSADHLKGEPVDKMDDESADEMYDKSAVETNNDSSDKMDDESADPLENPDIDPFVDQTWQELPEEEKGDKIIISNNRTKEENKIGVQEVSKENIELKDESIDEEMIPENNPEVGITADDSDLVFEQEDNQGIDGKDGGLIKETVDTTVDESDESDEDRGIVDSIKEKVDDETDLDQDDSNQDDSIKDDPDQDDEDENQPEDAAGSEEKKEDKTGLLHGYFQLIKFIQKEGVEVVVASLVRFVCSGVLIMGARANRPWLLIPWLVEESVEMVGGLLQLIMQTAMNGSWSFKGVLLLLILYVLGGYFLYSVASYHSLLRRMRKQSKEVISSVCQGGFQVGLNYQRLEEDCWRADPNLANEFKDREAGFQRESRRELDEVDDYVLYVK